MLDPMTMCVVFTSVCGGVVLYAVVRVVRRQATSDARLLENDDEAVLAQLEASEAAGSTLAARLLAAHAADPTLGEQTSHRNMAFYKKAIAVQNAALDARPTLYDVVLVFAKRVWTGARDSVRLTDSRTMTSDEFAVFNRDLEESTCFSEKIRVVRRWRHSGFSVFNTNSSVYHRLLFGAKDERERNVVRKILHEELRDVT